MLKRIDAAYILVPTFITEIEYQFLWSLEGYGLDNKIVEFFTAHYGLTRTVIPIPPLDEVPVYIFDVTLWAFIKVAIDNGEFECAVPCKLLTFAK